MGRFINLAVLYLLLANTVFCYDGDLEDENEDGFESRDDDDLLIGAFNIRVFGKTKMKKDNVCDILSKIIPRYDLLLVMEIRDSSQTAFPALVQRLNDESGSEDTFEFVTGRRVGRSGSKEQYGFIYRPDKLDIVRMYERDDEYDVFEREPVVVRFKRVKEGSGRQQAFTFIPMHAKPDDAVAEMNNLIDVYDEAERYFGSDAIIAGDLNADCSYVCKSCWDQCKLRKDARFLWMIPDESDTTVTNSNCAYDRILLAGKNLQKNACCARIFRFDKAYGIQQEEAEAVSDHYPVEFILH